MVPFVDLFAQYQSLKTDIDRAMAEVIERSGILGGRTPWFPDRDTQINEDRKLS